MFYQLCCITQRFDFLVVAKVCQNSDDHCLILDFDRARQGVLDAGIHMPSGKKGANQHHHNIRKPYQRKKSTMVAILLLKKKTTTAVRRHDRFLCVICVP